MTESGMGIAYFALLSTLCIGFALYETGYGFCSTIVEAFCKRIATFIISLASFAGITHIFNSTLIQNVPTFVLNLALLTVLTHIVGSVTRSIKHSCALGLILGGAVYPAFTQLIGPDGMLTEAGYYDVAGSGIVHFVGAVIALLMSAYQSKVQKLHCVSVKRPWLTSLGFMFVWAAWLVFTLIVSAPLVDTDPLAWLRGFIVASTAAGWGAVAAVVFTFSTMGKLRLKSCTIGGLAGLVIISADPFTVSFMEAVFYGIGAGITATLFSYLLYRVKIQDPCSVISIHGPAGAIGVLMVAASNSYVDLSSQLHGLIILAIFAVVVAVVLCELAEVCNGIFQKAKLNLHS